jgi:Fe-S cluster assembly protein SufD
MRKPSLVTNPKRMEGENPLADFARLEPGLPGDNIKWIKDLRKSGASRFAALGYPSQKVESWKYTGVSALATQRFTPISLSEARNRLIIPDAKRLEGARILAFEAGHFRPDLSELGEPIEGLEITSLADALDSPPAWLQDHLKAAGEGLEADAPFDALNLALMSGGAVIRVAENTSVEPVIELLHFASKAGAAHHVRTVVRAEVGSRVTIVETWSGDAANSIGGASWTNAITEIDIGDGAHVTYVKIQDEAHHAFHLGRTKTRLGHRAKFDAFVLSTGGRLARSEVLVDHAGEFSASTVNGVYVGHDAQHLDQVTRIDHAVPNATSAQVFKGVLDGKSRAVFQGSVIVRPDAQKTDARQANHTLLLSRQAEIDTKPELEIYADDVKCAHGATVGELNMDQLHYLKSRGIPETDARAMLVEAFVAEVAETIARENLRAHVLGVIRAAVASGAAS